MRVLVVDDEKDTRTTVQQVVKHAIPGAQVDAAPSAETALVKARDHLAAGEPYDVIITDFHMETMTGLDLLHILREDGNPAQGMLMSGDDAARELAQDDTAVQAFFAKPFEATALADALRRAWNEERDAARAPRGRRT